MENLTKYDLVDSIDLNDLINEWYTELALIYDEIIEEAEDNNDCYNYKIDLEDIYYYFEKKYLERFNIIQAEEEDTFYKDEIKPINRAFIDKLNKTNIKFTKEIKA